MHLQFQTFRNPRMFPPNAMVECSTGSCTAQFLANDGVAWLWQDEKHIYRALFCCHACFLDAAEPCALARA